MFEDLSDLDFGTYFNVMSNKQQDNCNEDRLSDSSDTARPLMDRNNSNLSTESHQQQQFYRFPTTSPIERKNDINALLDWNNNTSPIHSTPDSSPLSSSSNDDYIFSPPLNSPPYGLYRDSKSVNNFIVNNSTRPTPYSLNNILLHGDIPSIAIPTTPTTADSHIVFSQSDPVFPPTMTRLPSLESNLPKLSPTSGSTSEDREELVHPLDIGNTQEHETRNWRKPFGNYLRGVEPERQLKKVAHNAIERRYRNNINDRISELKNAVPALYKARINEKANAADSDDDDSDEIIEGVQVAKKLNKATILKKATEYICHLKTNNENAVQENMILQQIIAQMPGGPEALQHFRVEKNEFEKFETQRIARERRETLEQERLERKKILRERAAQRATLAQLLPKQERKPYRRRQSKKQDTKKATSDQSKMFMVGFMCLVFFTSAPNEGPSKMHHDYDSYEHSFSTSLINQTSDIPSRSLTNSARFKSLDLWNILRISVGIFGLIYLCLVPLVIYWLRPRPVAKGKSIKKSENLIHAVYSIIRNLFILLVPRLFAAEYEDNSTLDLVKVNEAQLVKEKSSRVTMLQNCTQMLVQLYNCDDELVKARGYVAAGIQLKYTPLIRKAQELVTGKTNSPEELVTYCQELDHLRTSWLSFLNNNDKYVAIPKSSNRLCQWLNLVGVTLQGGCARNSGLAALRELTIEEMKDYQTMVHHILEALNSQDDNQTLFYLDQAFKYNDSIPNNVAESSVLKMVVLCLYSKVLERRLDFSHNAELKDLIFLTSSNVNFIIPARIQLLLLK